jgi:cytochrome c biogenesis protein CcmG/thiol:disulfide interchange protein DsbE
MAAEPTSRGALRHAGRALAILLAAAFLALLAYGLATKSADSTIDDALADGRAVPAPSFDLPVLQRGDAADTRVAASLADGRLSLRELRGTPVVLNFWASWCVPCREETPELQRFWRAERERGTLVLGLDMQDLTDDARDFIRDHSMTYPVIRDRGNDVARAYGTTGIPETFFLSPRGRIVGHVVGVVTPRQLREGAAAARAGRPAGVAEGGARRPTRG